MKITYAEFRTIKPAYNKNIKLENSSVFVVDVGLSKQGLRLRENLINAKGKQSKNKKLRMQLKNEKINAIYDKKVDRSINQKLERKAKKRAKKARIPGYDPAINRLNNSLARK